MWILWLFWICDYNPNFWFHSKRSEVFILGLARNPQEWRELGRLIENDKRRLANENPRAKGFLAMSTEIPAMRWRKSKVKYHNFVMFGGEMLAGRRRGIKKEL